MYLSNLSFIILHINRKCKKEPLKKLKKGIVKVTYIERGSKKTWTNKK